MILAKRALTLAEVEAHIGKDEEKRPIHEYVKSFVKISKADAEKLTKELHALNNPKLREEKIVKIVDLLPKDSEDLNKIFNDVSLTEEESQAILTLVKEY